MLCDYVPKYKEEPRPLIGFTCTSNGGKMIDVYNDSSCVNGKVVIIRFGNGIEQATFTPDSLIEFANKLIEVANNRKLVD